MTSSNHPPDSFEEPMMFAHAMFRKGKREGACRFLARKKDEAVSNGSMDDAALYASVRGSYLVAMGRDDDALESYLEAEGLSKGESDSLLTTAWHLLYGMKQPEKALDKVNTVLASETNSIHVLAHGFRGLALLALDQTKEAGEELQTIFLGINELPARSCDLMLVEALSQRQLVSGLCQRYLDLVEAKAREEGEDRILKQVLEIKATWV